MLIAYLKRIDCSCQYTLITVNMGLAHCERSFGIVVRCKLESSYPWYITGMDEDHSSTDNQSANSDWNASLGPIPADKGIVGTGSLTHDVKKGASQGQTIEDGIEQSPSEALGESKHAAYTPKSDHSRVQPAAEAISAAAEQQHAAEMAADPSLPSVVHVSADQLSMLSLQERSMPMAPVSESHDEVSRMQQHDAAAKESCGQPDPASTQVDGLASSQEPPLLAGHPASAVGAADSQSNGHHTDVHSSVAASKTLPGQETGFLEIDATYPQGIAAATDAPADRETGVVHESASLSQAAAATHLPESQPAGMLQGAAGSSQSTAADSQAEQDPGILHSTAGLLEDTAATSAELSAAPALHGMQQSQPGLQGQSSTVEEENMELHASSIIPADHANPEGAESNGPDSTVHDTVHVLGA